VAAFLTGPDLSEPAAGALTGKVHRVAAGGWGWLVRYSATCTGVPIPTPGRPEPRPANGAGTAVNIVYETHSLTEDNEKGIATGWLPGKLSAQGRQFASQLGDRRRKGGLAAVFVSDLHRAVETAPCLLGYGYRSRRVWRRCWGEAAQHRRSLNFQQPTALTSRSSRGGLLGRNRS
jgi:hypothetical protein